MENDEFVDSSNWWYIKNSKNIGPHNESEMNELIHLGEIDRKTPVWCTGMKNWCNADTSLPSAAFDKAASKKAKHVNNRFAWALAIAPFAMYYFTELMLTVFRPEWSGTSIAVLVIILLTLILWGIDQDNLRKSGHRLSGWMYSGMWLVPVYLFVRARLTGRKYGYAICGIVPFAVIFLIVLVKSIF